MAAIIAVMIAAPVFGQTVIKPPKNKYTPQQDVELGRKAADEVRRQYPIIHDEKISNYLAKLGARLVESSPPELKEPIYEFSFTPVNLKEINAFALPGGPMFVYRGMFDAAASEAEVAGVMAHELSHVLLRHGTANATKAQNPWLQLGQIAGLIGGAAVGGAAGSAIAEGSQLGVGSVLLRYSRDYEKQADLLGAQIMARAGYDPRALARMFETIQRQSSGSRGPQWLSDHPDPGNRTEYITKEAELLTVATAAAADVSQFHAIKTAFAALPPAKSSAGASRANAARTEAPRSVGTPGQPLPRPSTEYRAITGGRVFQAAVPSDWTSLPSTSAIKVVPQNGYGEVNGETVFRCGVEFGVTKGTSSDLGDATNAFLDAVIRNNPSLHQDGTQKMTQLSQRTAIVTPLVNPSPLGGHERIIVYTTFLRDGHLFYYLNVVPEQDADAFQDAFRHVSESIRLTDGR